MAIVPEMHPLLAALLTDYRAGLMDEATYEERRKAILRDEIGLGAGTVASAPALPDAPNGVTVVSKAALQREDAERIRIAIEAGRKAGKTRSYVPAKEVRPEFVRPSVAMIVDGELVRRLLTDDEIKEAKRNAAQAAAALTIRPDSEPSTQDTHLDISIGFGVVDGIIRPTHNAPFSGKVAAKVVNPEVEAIRARWKAGEFGKGPEAAKRAKALCDAVLPPVAPFDVNGAYNPKDITQGRIDCPTCKGKPDKIIGKMCTCGGKGHLIVDMGPVIERTNRGATCIDPIKEDENAMSYTVFLATGLTATIHSANGQKAVRSACNNLRNSSGFMRVKLDRGCILVLHDYDTLCPACHGRKILNSRTCTSCQDGRVTRRGARFFFEDGEDGIPAIDRAHAAGLQAMTGYDPDATCGRKKCKAAEGGSCHACNDAKQGGYQQKGYVPCSECRTTGKINGVPHEKCHGKGRFNPTEFYWISDAPLECKACASKSVEIKKHCEACEGTQEVNAFTVTDEIRRADVLEEDLLPLRDRPLTVMTVRGKVLVGAGKVPSRKSGAFMSLTGTARQNYSTAKAMYGSQELVGEGRGAKWSHRQNQGIGGTQRVKEYRATFSGG